jgi:hypothetical protein
MGSRTDANNRHPAKSSSTSPCWFACGNNTGVPTASHHNHTSTSGQHSTPCHMQDTLRPGCEVGMLHAVYAVRPAPNSTAWHAASVLGAQQCHHAGTKTKAPNNHHQPQTTCHRRRVQCPRCSSFCNTPSAQSKADPCLTQPFSNPCLYTRANKLMHSCSRLKAMGKKVKSATVLASQPGTDHSVPAGILSQMQAQHLQSSLSIHVVQQLAACGSCSCKQSCRMLHRW